MTRILTHIYTLFQLISHTPAHFGISFTHIHVHSDTHTHTVSFGLPQANVCIVNSVLACFLKQMSALSIAYLHAISSKRLHCQQRTCTFSSKCLHCQQRTCILFQANVCTVNSVLACFFKQMSALWIAYWHAKPCLSASCASSLQHHFPLNSIHILSFAMVVRIQPSVRSHRCYRFFLQVMLNVLGCRMTYLGQAETNAWARFNIALRPRKPWGSLGRKAQDGHLDFHTAPELWCCSHSIKLPAL